MLGIGIVRVWYSLPMRQPLQLASLLILAALSGPCCAWNRAGHMLSGAVACHDLAQNHPQVVEQVVALMSSCSLSMASISRLARVQ